MIETLPIAVPFTVSSTLVPTSAPAPSVATAPVAASVLLTVPKALNVDDCAVKIKHSASAPSPTVAVTPLIVVKLATTLLTYSAVTKFLVFNVTDLTNWSEAVVSTAVPLAVADKNFSVFVNFGVIFPEAVTL